MSVRIAALSLLIVLALSGCGRQFVSPDVRPQDATFIGIRKALDNAPVVDVVYVHGMCTHTAEDIATKLDELLTQMHVPHAPLTPATLPKPSDLPYGGLLYEASYPSGSSKLRLHAILWSPITNPYKQRLCYDQTAKSSFCPLNSPSPPRRAALNANIKDGLLDNCLSDAVVYLGPAKEKIYRDARVPKGAPGGSRSARSEGIRL